MTTSPRVEDDKGTLQSTFSLHDFSVHVLFDTEAFHSFISADLCDKLNHILKPEPTSQLLCLSNPIGDPANLGMICKRVILFKNDRHHFTWDFYVFLGFDILLGIGWMTAFDAHMACKSRTISFVDDGGNPWVVECRMPFDFAGSFVFSLDACPSDLSITPVV